MMNSEFSTLRSYQQGPSDTLDLTTGQPEISLELVNFHTQP